MKRVIKAVQSHRRTAGFILAGLIFIVGGVFILPKFISADGDLLSSFGTSGVVMINPSSVSDVIQEITLDSNYLYAVGYSNYYPGEWRIEKRRLDTGALCNAANCGTEFGTGGAVISDPNPSGVDIAYDIAIDESGGYMYVIGQAYDQSYASEWRIEKRRLDTGALCNAANCGTEFGTGGAITTIISTRNEYAKAVVLDTTGQYIYIAGLDWFQSAGLKKRIRIEKRRASDGALCTAANCGTEFGTGGVKTETPFNQPSGINDIAVDSAALYTVGFEYARPGTPPCWQWRMEERSLTTGALLGNQYYSPNCGNEEATHIALDLSSWPSGFMFVAGEDVAGGRQWRIQKRTAGGSLCDTTINCGTVFGTDGSIVINPSSGFDSVRDIAVNSSGLFIIGDDYSPGNGQWRMEKRNKNDGSQIWVRTSNPSSDWDVPYAVAVDSAGDEYVAGMDRSLDSAQWRIEKRRTIAPVSAPTVTTQSAGSVGDSSAVLNGLANPNNASTTGWFRYDTTSPGPCNDTFGTRAPSSGGTSLGSGSTDVSFFQTISGLNSTATYYFCAIAENSAGKSYGSVLNFTTAAPGAISSYGVTREGCELKNWGWGSEVTGWVSFNSTNNYAGKTPGANYGASLTNFCQNVAPNVPSNLAVTDTSSANWSFNCVSPLQPAFSWTFSDPNTDDSQYAYQVQVDDNSDFSSPEYDSGSATTTSLTATVPPGSLSYNTIYNWRVKTWDNRKTPLASPWTTGTPFTTTVHAWPSPDFTFLPNSPSVGQDTLFRRDQDSDGDTFGTRCFDSGNNVVACGNYYWTMEDSSPAMSNIASSSIPVIVSFNSTGRKEISLKATDANGFYCLKSRSTGTVTLPLPQYKEVLPR